MSRLFVTQWIARHKLLMTLTVLFVLIIIIIIYCSKPKKHKLDQQYFPLVRLATVKSKKSVATLTAIGTVKAIHGIQVSAERAGKITAISFRSGQNVRAGQILVTLKNSDLKAIIQKDRVRYQLAKLNAERLNQLVGNSYVSKQEADQTTSEAKQVKAQLAHDIALLQDTVVKAPFSGQVGIRQVDIGQYVNPGQVIVSLQDRSKMYIDFTIPEKQSSLVMLGEAVVATTQQNKHHQYQGKVIALGSQMNKNTRALPVRAELNPPYLKLTPGMSVHVTMLLPDNHMRPSVPQSAIIYNPYGNFVYLYHKGTVTQRYVILGRKVGSTVLIEKGVKIGDLVVTQGQRRLFNGALVKVVEI